MRDQEQIVVGGGPSIVAPWLGVRYLLDFTAGRQLKEEGEMQFSSSGQPHLKLIGEVPEEDARRRVDDVQVVFPRMQVGSDNRSSKSILVWIIMRSIALMQAN
ncbi:uncharacterized protein PgNI_04332 [Pyricularia grisea]|uniref:Uncharacterized protein n=1 Tax=Pyricularia grisea TaxID=148305 RepID=A0A6P8B9N0_PYRGI|nr:uncharacterized protein PgNI_04332 [Pyricularia grisea]TLD12529.1 hypothetical protein PgNI_04332 [Pyricularia grisea]